MLQQYLPLAVLKQQKMEVIDDGKALRLQQYLPLAVLKLDVRGWAARWTDQVATVLTACGIETLLRNSQAYLQMEVATVLTACGIETRICLTSLRISFAVATVLTACGIETVSITVTL